MAEDLSKRNGLTPHHLLVIAGRKAHSTTSSETGWFPENGRLLVVTAVRAVLISPLC